MNIIIDSNFKARFKGQNLTAAEHDGEFVFSENSDFSISTLKEIAKANGFEIPSKELRKKANAHEFVFNTLNTSENIVEAKMSNLDQVKEIVNVGVSEGKSDDEIKIAIVQSGISFKDAQKFFQQAMEECGHRISPKARFAKICDVLDEMEFNPDTPDEVSAVAEKLAEQIDDTSEKQALAAMRKWAKENEIELPKPAKKAGGAGRGAGGGLIQKGLDWLVENKDADAEAITNFILSAKDGITEAQAKKYVSSLTQSLEFARKFAAC